MKILVVDDDFTVRELFRVQLTELGHEVHLSVNGLDGYDQAMKLNPDVIITDMQMPYMCGDEMLKQILDRRPWTKCFAMSASMSWRLPTGVRLYLKPEAITEIINGL